MAVAATLRADVRPENKWRIQCSEGAKSNGTIVFRITPVGGDAIEVHAFVKDGTRANKIAKVIRNAFRESLPARQFKVEVEDNEDVLVKRRLGKPKFGLEVLSVGVRAVRINLDRE